MSEWKYQPARDHGLAPMARMRSFQREAGLFSATARVILWTAWSALLRVWNGLRVVGREHLPQSGSFILIANHESHLDVFALAAALPMRARQHFIPLSAEDVFFDRPTRTFLAAHILNALPVKRGRGVVHGFAAMRERLLREPTVFVLFPAGKRSRDGSFVPFRAGIGMLVAGSEIPVVPCYVDGAFEALRPQTKLLRPARMTVTIGAPIVFRDVSDNREGWDTIRVTLERSVRALGNEPALDEHAPQPSAQ